MEATNPYSKPLQPDFRIIVAILIVLLVGLDISFGSWDSDYHRVVAVFETSKQIDIIYQVNDGVAIHSNSDTIITPGKRVPVFTVRGHSGILYYRNFNYQ